MFKKAIVFIIAFVIGAICAVAMASTIKNVVPSYYVEQYVFDDGLKITIDRNTFRNRNGEIQYLGCYNNGHDDIVFIYMSDESWDNVLFTYDQEYYLKKQKVKEWRW